MHIIDNFPEYKNCRLCPKRCHVDRYAKKGFCGEDSRLSIDAALLHHGEEPPISFKKGSGTIFFTGCPLRCPFCQNMQISRSTTEKKYYSTKEFINMMIGLIDEGAENLNFVTPDHFLPHISEGIRVLRNLNYNLPAVYNSSGYHNIDDLKSAAERIDIFLFDYKYADSLAALYCINTPDYPDTAAKALDYLYKNSGNLKLDDDGKAVKGVIVRHLVMPGFVENSIKVVNELYFNYGTDIYLSLMSQYSPRHLKKGFEKIDRRLTRNEYEEVLELAYKLGMNGFFQEFISHDDGYLPDFKDKNNVFKGE
jgi:putative pyruvate formate lyase activating enzyme